MKQKASDLFQIYLDALRSIGWHAGDFLTVGKGDGALRDLEKHVGAKIPDDVSEIYAHTNGTDKYCGKTLDQIVLFPIYFLLSIEESLSVRSQFFNGVYSQLLPVLGNDMGDYCFVELSGGSGRFGAIYELAEGYAPTIIHLSFRDMIKTHIAAIADSSLFVSDSFCLMYDFPKYSKLARKMNPEVEFWAK